MTTKIPPVPNFAERQRQLETRIRGSADIAEAGADGRACKHSLTQKPGGDTESGMAL